MSARSARLPSSTKPPRAFGAQTGPVLLVVLRFMFIRQERGGSANLLHAEHHYSDADIEDALPFVQLLVPGFLPAALRHYGAP